METETTKPYRNCFAIMIEIVLVTYSSNQISYHTFVSSSWEAVAVSKYIIC